MDGQQFLAGEWLGLGGDFPDGMDLNSLPAMVQWFGIAFHSAQYAHPIALRGLSFRQIRNIVASVFLRSILSRNRSLSPMLFLALFASLVEWL